MTKPITENKMGVMPEGKLLINMALPLIASMLVQALYNIVDSLYVARISESAVTALSWRFRFKTCRSALPRASVSASTRCSPAHSVKRTATAAATLPATVCSYAL